MMAKVWGKCGGITEDVTSARLGEPSVCSVFMHLDLVLWGGGRGSWSIPSLQSDVCISES